MGLPAQIKPAVSAAGFFIVPFARRFQIDVNLVRRRLLDHLPNRPAVRGQAARHCWGRLQLAVNADVVVVEDVQAKHGFVVRPLLGEAVREPSHASHERAEVQVLALDV